MPDPRQLDLGRRSFADGLLVELVAVLREMIDGDLVAVRSAREDVGESLAAWSKLTGHAIVKSSRAGTEHEWVIRKGEARAGSEPARPIGSRIWLYSNFDCNLSCDYCCVRSSPSAVRRALGLETIRRIAEEARPLGIDGFYVTGGEPFLLADIGEILEICTDVAPTTLLTNAMLFTGKRLERLSLLPRDRLVLQVSIDSPSADLHDLHRGRGSWTKAMAGARLGRELGFRVRLAATVSSDADEARFRDFLDAEGVAAEDRVVRRVALRGFAEEGIALGKADLVPEVTLTAGGVYWHPVGADDADFLVTTSLFPLTEAIGAVQQQWQREREHHDELAAIFHCA